MKKLNFLAVATIALMASCTKTELLTTDNDLNPIAFENFIHKTTKAAEAVETTVEANGFGVSAFYTNTSSSTSTYFENIDVTYNSTKDRYPTTYYWPIDGTMAFYAVYPNDKTINSTNKTIDSYATEGAEDLMIATALSENCATHCTANPNAPVALAFSHILTQVYFEIKGEEATNKYKVEKIVLDAKNVATYTYSDGSWTAPSTAKTYTYKDSQSSPAEFTGSSYVVYGTKADNSLMLIPQSNVTVNVYYTVETPAGAVLSKFNEDDDTNHHMCKSFVASSSSVDTDVDWAKGQIVKYQLTLPIGVNPIEFTATVNAWTTETAQEVTWN